MHAKRNITLVLVLGLALSAGALAGCSGGSDEGSAGSTATETGSAEVAEEVEATEIEVNVGTSSIAEPATSYVGKDESVIKDWISDDVYNLNVQTMVADELDSAKEAGAYTLDAPLVYYNPFGSNTLSLYVYFQTEEACAISYTVSMTTCQTITLGEESVNSCEIADFTREVADGENSTEHEFQLIGLVPNATNTITLTATYTDGTSESVCFDYEMGGVLNTEELLLDITEGDSDAELSDGMYVILGNDGKDSDGLRCMYYYDNNGVLRGEVPIISYRSHRLISDDEATYFSISSTKMAAMDELGQITNVYDLGEYDYELHHDYVFDGDGNILILATYTGTNETVEDMVVSLDPDSGEVELVLDMGDLLPDYKEEAIAYHEENYEPVESDQGDESDDDGVDWIHLNTIQWLDDGSIIVSSRETSTIMKIDDLYGEPSIEYMLCSEEYWEGTEYEDLVYEQVGDFTVQGGQHTVTYIEDDSLEEGQYYLAMFNNNIGYSEAVTSGFDYDSVGLTNEDAVSDTVQSYYYKYLVDENEGTFELVQSIGAPLSGYVSSVQDVDGNIIIDSGIPGVFSEYDEDGELIATFTMDTEKFIYRVFKYDL